jgi:hypothetical protein
MGMGIAVVVEGPASLFTQEGLAMKVWKSNGTVRVTVSAQEVDEFKNRWPCSELPDKAIRFLFDRNGGLLDVSTSVECGSVAALAEDAWEYAQNHWRKAHV